MKLPLVEDYMEPSLEDIYQRHNQELRKIPKVYPQKKEHPVRLRKLYLATVEAYLKRETVRLHF